MNNIKTTHRPHNTQLSDAWVSNFGQIMSDILHEPARTTHIAPRIDLIEKENGYELLAAIPGVQKTDVSIAIEDGLLKLSTKESDSKETEGKSLVSEILKAEYKRTIRLPKNADTESTDATLENGILKIYLAKRKESLPKQIEIK